jgi:hypothetical protein
MKRTRRSPRHFRRRNRSKVMRQWLTGDDLANWLVMLRTADRRTYLILEGPSDCQALDPHINEARAISFPAHAKSVALRAMEVIKQQNVERVVAVVDRDWTGILNADPAVPDVIYTERYDLEATIIFTGEILQRLISSVSDRATREADNVPSLGSAAARVIEISGVVGTLRLVSARDRLGIACDGFPVHEVLTEHAESVDISRLAAIAVARSKHAAIDVSALIAVIERESENEMERAELCNGHDLAMTIATLTKRWGGNASKGSVEQAVRTAFSCSELKTTALYRRVASWARESGTEIWSCV